MDVDKMGYLGIQLRGYDGRESDSITSGTVYKVAGSFLQEFMTIEWRRLGGL